MKKHFYIFRHGQTVWNAEGRPQGQHPYPVPLTMNGREQAASLAEKLADRKIKRLISSDLLRAAQTAEIVAGWGWKLSTIPACGKWITGS